MLHKTCPVMVVVLWLFALRATTLAGEPSAPKPPFDPTAYRRVLLEEPWNSKGLPPVKLALHKDRPALTLADKGVAKVKIVAQTKAPYYREVAEFLKTHLDKATGADFYIADDGAPIVGPAIFVGPVGHPPSKDLFAKAQALPLESIVVEASAAGVVLVGCDKDSPYLKNPKPISIRNEYSSRGTFFAVVDFLERFVGVRWYFPTEMGLFVPDLRARALKVPAMRYQDSPVYTYRYSTFQNSDPLDNQWLKANRPPRVIWNMAMRSSAVTLASHNHTDCLWHEFYAKDHPEYFALRADGTRMVGPELSSQRCYTNKAGFQEHLRIIAEYYKTGEGARKFSYPEFVPNDEFIYWLPNDGFQGCECPQCQKLTDKDAPPGEVYSRLIFTYAAKLAAAIKQRWPGKKLKIMAYGSYSGIPADIKLPKNVSLVKVWSEIPEGFMKEAPYWKWNTEDIDKLAPMSCDKLTLWSHYPIKPRSQDNIDQPYMAPHVLSKLYRQYRNKVSGVVLNGGLLNYALNGHILYIYFKVLWNPDVDVDEALAEYCAAMFGDGAADMKAWYDTAIGRWEDVKWSYLPQGRYRLSGRMPEKLYWGETYPPEVRKAMQTLLQHALAKVENDPVCKPRMQYFADATACFFAQGRQADETVRKTMACPAVAAAPRIDGDLREWQEMTPVTLDDNATGKAASPKTEIYTACDGENFYVAGRVHEPDKPALPDRKQPRDSPLWEHDSIEIYLCANQPGFDEAGFNLADQHHQIVIDARGSIFDGYKGTNDLNLKPEVNIAFTLATRPMGNGFTFEMAIPYRSLNARQPAPGATWLVNFYRNRPRKGEPGYQAWSPTLGAPFKDTTRFGILRFPEKVLGDIDFDTNNPNWGIKEDGPVKAELRTEGGRLIVHVKALDTLKASTTARFLLDNRGNFPTIPLTKPVAMEWRFRYTGRGLEEAWLYLGSLEKRAATLKHRFAQEAITKADASWTTLRYDLSKEQNNMENIAYYSFGLKVAPGADVTFEVDDIKAVEK